MIRNIEKVEHLGGTRLLLTFVGGERRVVDLATFVEPTGVFSALHDAAFMRSVRVDSEIRTIVWPNGADLCPDVLYDRSEPDVKQRDSAA